MGVEQTPDLGFLCASVGCSPRLSGMGLPKPSTTFCHHAPKSVPQGCSGAMVGLCASWYCWSCQVSRFGVLCTFSRSRWPHLSETGSLSCHLGMEEGEALSQASETCADPGCPSPQWCPTARGQGWYETGPECPVYAQKCITIFEIGSCLCPRAVCEHLQLFCNPCHLDNINKRKPSGMWPFEILSKGVYAVGIKFPSFQTKEFQFESPLWQRSGSPFWNRRREV